jgi:hypothetical protein
MQQRGTTDDTPHQQFIEQNIEKTSIIKDKASV